MRASPSDCSRSAEARRRTWAPRRASPPRAGREAPRRALARARASTAGGPSRPLRVRPTAAPCQGTSGSRSGESGSLPARLVATTDASYEDRMPRKAVSVTLEVDNLHWLRGQVRATPGRSLSAVLDRLIAEARSRGRVDDRSIRSVRGTVTISADDPDLRTADDAVRGLFPSLRRRASGKRARRAPGLPRG